MAGISKVGLSLLLLAALLIISWDSIPSRGHHRAAALQVCRSWVEPCQRVLGLPRGGTATLDLRLKAPAARSHSWPAQLVAWETHLSVTNSLTIKVLSEPGSRRPVQELGERDFVLNNLARMEDVTSGERGRYFTVQNRYDSASDSLDYAVALLDFAESGSATAAILLDSGDSILLGSIRLRGVAEGSASITIPGASARPSQIVILDGNSQVSTFQPTGENSPLATINVGTAAATVDLHGQITLQYPGDVQALSSSGKKLKVSFWETGATPPWRKGNASPLATFYNLSPDGLGRFRITDIAPSLLPQGVYDLRVQSPGSLTSVIPGVALPSPESSLPSSPNFQVSLRGGDTDGNNVVDSLDLASLKASFGKLEGEKGYSRLSDLSGDGVVDGMDFSRMAQNLGERSE